jgi:hypothetical protein
VGFEPGSSVPEADAISTAPRRQNNIRFSCMQKLVFTKVKIFHSAQSNNGHGLSTRWVQCLCWVYIAVDVRPYKTGKMEHGASSDKMWFVVKFHWLHPPGCRTRRKQKTAQIPTFFSKVKLRVKQARLKMVLLVILQSPTNVLLSYFIN